MNLFDQISDDIRLAMLARDKERLEALRNVKKVLIEAKTAKSGAEELTDDAALKAIAKLVTNLAIALSAASSVNSSAPLLAVLASINTFFTLRNASSRSLSLASIANRMSSLI